MTITNPNYISLTLATGVFKIFFLHLYETYCFHFKLSEGTSNAVCWKRCAVLLVILDLLLFLKSLHFGAIFAPFSSYIHLMSSKYERNRSWIATLFPALLFFAMLSCHLPSPNLYVLYPVTFETALLHALTVTLIVHRGKARYSRFEDLSDVSLSRNRCGRVYLD